jgi:hypothetical protein
LLSPDRRSTNCQAPEKARGQEASKHLVQRFHVSERRACRLLGQHRSTQRYQAVPGDYEQRLVKRMNERCS